MIAEGAYVCDEVPKYPTWNTFRTSDGTDADDLLEK